MPHCQTLLQTLRQNGNRITPQREMIIEAIAHSDRHLSAEEIFAQVQKRTRAINIATIYRTLDLLVSAGLASRIDLGECRVVYATRQHGPHIHLVCRECGHVLDADQSLIASLGEELHIRYSFSADLEHLSLPGLCPACKTESQA